jgi:hypothetical protein
LRAVRVLGVVVVAVQLASMIAFGASMYTILLAASSMASGDSMAMVLTLDEAVGVGVLRLDAVARNGGLLGVNLDLGVSALDEAGEPLARNSTSVHLGAGEGRAVSLSLSLPFGVMRRITVERRGRLEVTMDLRTLNDLVGVSNTMTVREGGSR